MEKKASIRVERSSTWNIFFDFSEWARQASTLAPPLLAPMNESNYKMHNVLENYSSHNYMYIKIHARMHPKS